METDARAMFLATPEFGHAVNGARTALTALGITLDEDALAGAVLCALMAYAIANGFDQARIDGLNAAIVAELTETEH